MPTSRAELHRLLLLIKEISARIGSVRNSITAAGEATVEALDENAKATQKAAEQQPPPPPSRIAVDVQIPREETDRYYIEHGRSYRLQLWTFGAAIATFLAVAVYAVITYMEWCQMKRATDLSEKANRDAWTLANRANQTAINAERPWVGMAITIRDWIVGQSPTATVLYINSGRRPAKLLLARFDSRDFSAFPKDPPYHRNPTDVNVTGLILPNGSMSNTQTFARLTQDRLNDLGLRRHAFFIYASIDYEDPLTHVKHWTHGCWQYLPGFNNLTSGFVNCAVYNDVDEDKQEQQQP